MKTHSIGTLIHYPVPVHLQPAYQGRVAIGGGGLQHTEQACREIVSLPMHPQITDEQAQRVGELIVHWYRKTDEQGYDWFAKTINTVIFRERSK